MEKKNFIIDMDGMPIIRRKKKKIQYPICDLNNESFHSREELQMYIEILQHKLNTCQLTQKDLETVSDHHLLAVYKWLASEDTKMIESQ